MTPEELYSANERLVYKVLKRYHPRLQFDEDLRQIGRLGLWKACITYNEDISKFSTYACMCILNELRQHFRYISSERRSNSIGSDVSLNESVGDDESMSLEELIVGSPDVDWVDFDGFWNSLTEIERVIVTKAMDGKTQSAIAKEIGKSQPYISRMFATIRKKFNRYI